VCYSLASCHFSPSSELTIRGMSHDTGSGYFENQAWGALLKAWKGYKIAKNKGEEDKLVHYAEIIQELQDNLGRQVASFPEIGKSALAFYSLRAAQIAQKNEDNSNNNDCNNNNNHHEQISEEEYLSGKGQIDNYEEDYADDNAYSENFTDDYH
jgi:hypothetical protein